MSARGKPDERLAARYELLDELGRGGMGVVHRARERATGREVALKLIALDALDPEARARFRREAEAWAAVRDPGVVTVFAAGEEAARGWIACELIPAARTLEQAWEDLPRAERARLLVEVGRTLGQLHARGLVHRDVKGSNVLVGRDGRPRLTDFGLVLPLADQRLTRTGELLGTPAAMAPEQALGRREAIGPWTDVWALGALLYQALTDRRPWEGRTPLALLEQVAAGPPARRPRELDPAIPLALEEVCLRALAHDPRARHADGAAFAATLEQALQGGDGGGGRRARVLLAWVLPALVLAALGAAAWRLAGSTRVEPAAPPSADPLAVPTSGRPEPDPGRRPGPASLPPIPSLRTFGPWQGEDAAVHQEWSNRASLARRQESRREELAALRGCVADLRCARCAGDLGRLLSDGSPEELEEGLRWLLAAAQAGEPRSAWRYAELARRLGRDDPARVREWARFAAEDEWLARRGPEGPPALELYAEMLLDGWGGPRDPRRAAALLEQRSAGAARPGLLRLQARALREGEPPDEPRAAGLEVEAVAQEVAAALKNALDLDEWTGGAWEEWQQAQELEKRGRRAEALAGYRRCALEHGVRRAAERLADRLQRGTPEERREALGLYRGLVRDGRPGWGVRYAELGRELGIGDPAELRRCLEDALAVPDLGAETASRAREALATWLEEGYGGPADPERARALRQAPKQD